MNEKTPRRVGPIDLQQREDTLFAATLERVTEDSEQEVSSSAAPTETPTATTESPVA